LTITGISQKPTFHGGNLHIPKVKEYGDLRYFLIDVARLRSLCVEAKMQPEKRPLTASLPPIIVSGNRPPDPESSEESNHEEAQEPAAKRAFQEG
jgi:hypothetical protein